MVADSVLDPDPDPVPDPDPIQGVEDLKFITENIFLNQKL
jgi:hypothetical protein